MSHRRTYLKHTKLGPRRQNDMAVTRRFPVGDPRRKDDTNLALIHLTQVETWRKKIKNRKHNKMARASRKANRGH